MMFSVVITSFSSYISQGRTTLAGRESAAGVRRRRVREAKELEDKGEKGSTQEGSTSDNVEVLPR